MSTTPKQATLPLLADGTGAEVVTAKSYAAMTREERRQHIAESIATWAKSQRARGGRR